MFLSMKKTLKNRGRARGRTTVAAVLGVLVGTGLGLAVSTLWTHRATQARPDTARSDTTGEPQGLSEGTKAVLKHLEAPMELRFYSVIDPSNAPEELKALAHRADQLLSFYQQESNGKIKVTRLTSLSYTNASAAASSGIKPFTLNNGNECSLGLVVLYKGKREVVPQLMPEWEPAMEIDITRAIQNAINSAPASVSPVITAASSPATMQDLKRIVPDLESVSLADGTKILREAALKEFEQAAKESQAQLKDAQQGLAQAQAGGSDADQQAAVKHLQEVQAAQSERLKEIAAKSRAQMELLKALKGSGQ